MPLGLFAQGNTWTGESLAQMVDSARWKLGALRVNAALQVTNAGHDSDIYFGYLEDPVPDFTLSASSPVQIFLPLGRTAVLEVQESPQYAHYLDTERERAWNNRLQGRFHVALKKLYLQAEAGLENVRRRVSPELNLNIRQISRSMGATALWQASRGVSMALLYGGATYAYGEPGEGEPDIAAILDRREDLFDAIVYYQPSPRVRFSLGGQHGLYGFTTETTRDTRSFGALGGIEFIPRTGEGRVPRGVGGAVRLGYMVFDLIEPGVADASNLVGEADLYAGLFRLTTVRAHFARSFQFSVYSSSTYYLSTRFGGGITRHLSRRAYLSYDLSLIRSAYPGDDPEGGGAGFPAHRYLTHELRLDLRLTRYLEIALVGSMGTRTLSVDGLSRHRNFVGIDLRYGVPMGNITAPAGGLTR